MKPPATSDLPCPSVFLIGPRGSGKTTVARLLARELIWDWIDADEYLEQQAGRSIRDLFAAEGEAGFREREASILRELCQRQRHVIATGGGVVLRDDNRRLLKHHGRIVWLTADPDTLWQRIQGDQSTGERRPNLIGGGRDEVVAVLKARETLYRDCARISVSTALLSPDEVVKEILTGLDLPR